MSPALRIEIVVNQEGQASKRYITRVADIEPREVKPEELKKLLIKIYPFSGISPTEAIRRLNLGEEIGWGD